MTIDKDGQWLIDDEPTGWYCTKKGETATVIVPEVGADGYWYFVNKETGKLEKSTYKAAPVSAVEADGICTLTVVNPDGTTTVVKLPTTAASITEIEFVGYTDAMVISMHSLLLVKIWPTINILCHTLLSMQHRITLGSGQMLMKLRK